MSDIWSRLEKAKERIGLLQFVWGFMFFFMGILINYTSNIIEWFEITTENRRDVVILLEKSEEFTAFMDNVKSLQVEIQKSKEDNLKLESRIQTMDIEIKASFKRLEDGQLQLFLKTERLDERTSRKK